MKIVRRPMVSNISTDVSTPSNTLARKKPGWSQYVFPREDTVPPDSYYSEIVKIENTITYSKEKAIAVYYKIAKFSDVYKKANHLSEKNEKLKILYIKQVYPINSDAYDRFIDTMYEELGLNDDENITVDDCIGLTEAISIGYISRSGIGSIMDRCYWDEECFVEQYQEQQQICSGDNDYYGIEYDEYGNVI